MDRENQIEEMAEAIFQNCNCGLFFSESEKIARFVIEEQGYRKQSEVTKEIFEEIERILSLNYCCCLPQGATEHYEYYEGNIAKDIAELKKKYTGEKRRCRGTLTHILHS